MTSPLVSVVIATWNSGRYLPETLDSALAQTYPAVEIIVVDDGSTDDTVDRLQPYLSRIRYIRREHACLAAARNAGLLNATGDYIALLDADDLWLPEKLAVQVEIAGRNPASGLIACDGLLFGGPFAGYPLLSGAARDAFSRTRTDEITSHSQREFIDSPMIGCPAQTLMPRRVVQEIGPFVNHGAQDYDYYLRISERFPVTFHRHSLARWREHGTNMSGAVDRRALGWLRLRIRVLRDFEKRAAPAYRALASRRIATLRGVAAVYHAQLFGRARALRVVIGLLRRQPWPPDALLSLFRLAAPRFSRRVIGAIGELRGTTLRLRRALTVHRAR